MRRGRVPRDWAAKARLLPTPPREKESEPGAVVERGEEEAGVRVTSIAREPTMRVFEGEGTVVEMGVGGVELIGVESVGTTLIEGEETG